MGMTADQLDRRVQFQPRASQMTACKQAWGLSCPTEAPLRHHGATYRMLKRWHRGTCNPEVTARFCVRSCQFTRGLTTADRLICDGATFNILGIKEFGQRRTFLEITAVSAGGQ